jgi:hypothetical protein
LPVLAVLGVVLGVYGGVRLGGHVSVLNSAHDQAAGTTSVTAAADKSMVTPAAGAPVAGSPVVPVYWVAPSDGRALLTREYVQVPDTGNTAASALRTILEQRPVDPDYTSPWQPSTVVSVKADAEGITVDLSAEAFADTSVDAGTAAIAIQQLLWTVTSAVQKDLPVTILVDGNGGYRAWGSVSLTEPLRRSDGVLATVWIDSPHENASVPPSVHVTGRGRAAGHRFDWKVTAGSRAVASGTVTGSAATADGWSQFAIDLSLPTGSYLLTVSAQPSDPAGTLWSDTKRFRG